MSAPRAPTRVLLPGFAGTELPGWLERRLADGLAGVCLFASNIDNPAQLRRLTTSIRRANPLALIALDEEGGDVTRLYARAGSPYPGNAWLGRLDETGETERHSRLIARQLRAAGCNLNFAPCLDVNSNPLNPIIGVRSFGADAGRVARHGAAWIRGHQSEGVAACAKHFPGHGDTALDSHLSLPRVDRDLDELLARELVPFASAIQAGVWAVMTSHLLLPALDPTMPATFSPAILQTLLRDRLGFDGVVVSDALDMAGASGAIGIPEAAVRALAGGCDLLCIGSDNSGAQLDAIERMIAAAVEDGRLPAGRLEAASDRVHALARRVAASDDLAAGSVEPDFGDPVRLAPSRLASCFDISARAASVLSRAASEGVVQTLVRLNTSADIASGPTPWGPFAALALQDPSRVGPSCVRVEVVEAWPSTRLSGQQLPGTTILVGRNNHRHGWVRDLIDRTRAAHPQALAIDMGWPDASRTYADIATFGSSRSLGSALLELLLPADLTTCAEVG